MQYPELTFHFNDLKYHSQACGDGIGIQGEILSETPLDTGSLLIGQVAGPCSDLFWGEQNLGEFVFGLV